MKFMKIEQHRNYLGTPIVITVVLDKSTDIGVLDGSAHADDLACLDGSARADDLARLEEAARAENEAILNAVHSDIDSAFKECERIECSYSRFMPGNELAGLNAHLGEWVRVSQELYDLIAFGEDLKKITAGAFDLTVKSILEGWGYDPHYSLKEGEQGHTGLIALKDGKVRLEAEIELGGLGKGYAIDRMFSCLQNWPNVCINAGGDLRVKGHNPEGRPWRIAFEHPSDLTQVIGYVDVDADLNGLALACSSPSRRSWRNRHHLVDPRRMEPADQMMAVYTQSENALLADAYSTALFVLGFEQAQKFLLEAPVEALLVSPKGEMFRSEGFRGLLFGMNGA